MYYYSVINHKMSSDDDYDYGCEGGMTFGEDMSGDEIPPTYISPTYGILTRLRDMISRALLFIG
jgi:hypothetical protein